MKQPAWEYRLGYALKCGEYQRLYRDDAIGVQMERFVSPRKSKTVFFIDGDDTEYATCEAMMEALESKEVAKCTTK